MPWYLPVAWVTIRLLGRLAPDTSDRCGAALGLLAFHLGIRRRVVSNNLRLALGLRGSRRRRVSQASFQTTGANFLSLFALAADPADARRRVVRHAPLWEEHLRRRFSAPVFLTGHLGCWDVPGSKVADLWGDLVVYATPQHERRMDRLINAAREALGMRVLLAAHGDRRGAITALRALRGGCPLGLLADQGPRPGRGEPGWFLGRATYCHAGPAFFAGRAGHPLVPAFALRRRAGSYLFVIGRPLPVTGEVAVDMQTGLDCLSAIIARFPGRYFWHHRRFKYRAPAPPCDRGRRPIHPLTGRVFYD